MTELADAPQAVKAINHWIGGGAVRAARAAPGRSSTRRPAARPARSTSPRAEEVDAAVQAAKAAFPAWRVALARPPRRALLPRSGSSSTAHRRTSRACSPPSTARCSRTRCGEVTRGLEVIEFCCGIPTLLKGGYQRAGLDRRSTSTRFASRSASSPGSRRSTSRRWSRCGCGRRRSPAGTRSCSSRPRRTRPPRC